MPAKAANWLDRIPEVHRAWLGFVGPLMGIYAIWKIFQYTVNHTPPLLAWWEGWTDQMAHGIATLVGKLMQATGYAMSFHHFKAVYPLGTPGFMVEEHCLAIPATLICGAIIAVYPGPWKHKLWYIPLAMLAVQAMNTLRIWGLAVLLKHAEPRYWQFNHSVTALILEYGALFFMVALWMRRYQHWGAGKTDTNRF